jgi:hypothetical protein
MDPSLIREVSSSNPGSNKTGAQQLGGRRWTTSASLESSSLLLLQCGSRYAKQRAPATPAVGTAVTQR